MPEGETKCLSPGTPRVSRGCGDHRLERLPDAGTRRCHQTQPSTHQMSRCSVWPCDYCWLPRVKRFKHHWGGYYSAVGHEYLTVSFWWCSLFGELEPEEMMISLQTGLTTWDRLVWMAAECGSDMEWTDSFMWRSQECRLVKRALASAGEICKMLYDSHE